MTTTDGISTRDWDVVHDLTLNIVNATTIEGRATSRSRLFVFLDELESKYGTLPSILATRADFIDDSAAKVQLLQDAYSIAEIRADKANLLYVSHSLAEFYVEESPDQIRAQEWLGKLKKHLLEKDDSDIALDYARLYKELGASVGRDNA
jgi:hypothetical protein